MHRRWWRWRYFALVVLRGRRRWRRQNHSFVSAIRRLVRVAFVELGLLALNNNIRTHARTHAHTCARMHTRTGGETDLVDQNRLRRRVRVKLGCHGGVGGRGRICDGPQGAVKSAPAQMRTASPVDSGERRTARVRCAVRRLFRVAFIELGLLPSGKSRYNKQRTACSV